MGMEQKVDFSAGNIPDWTSVQEFLTARDFPVQMRMIDGQLAFPDEVPPPDWNEIRLGIPPGMVTLRREGKQIRFVIWGNADEAMRQGWNVLVWAFAHLGNGQVETTRGLVSADEYRLGERGA